MQVIIIDGYHKGQVIDWHKPMPTIRLLKPKSITVCDCDYPDTETFENDKDEIEYKCAFRSVDNEVALFSTTGKSMDIFNGFSYQWQKEPWHPDTVFEFNCHDARAFK